MKKNYLYIILVIIMLTLSGCKAKKNEVLEPEKPKAKCDIFSCMEKLDVKSELNEMNELIGLNAVLKEETETAQVYVWQLTDDTSIEVRLTKFTSSITNTTTISSSFSSSYPAKIAPHISDFSKWEEIKEKYRSKEGITYDELVNLVGGIDGVLETKTSGGSTYKWYNSDGGYITSTFNTNTGKCSWISGKF